MNDERLKDWAERNKEIYDTEKAVKGEAFVLAVDVVFAVRSLTGIVRHMATCHDPRCNAGMLAEADYFSLLAQDCATKSIPQADLDDMEKAVNRLHAAKLEAERLMMRG